MLWLLPLGLALGHVLGTCLGDHAGAPALEAGQELFAALGILGAPLAMGAMHRLFRSGRDRAPIHLSTTAIVACQVVAFLAIEVAEHLLTGVPLSQLFTHRGLWWAVLGQIVIACLVAAAAQFAVAAGHASSAPAKKPWPPRVAPPRPGLLTDVVEELRAGGPLLRRGPPPSLIPA